MDFLVHNLLKYICCSLVQVNQVETTQHKGEATNWVRTFTITTTTTTSWTAGSVAIVLV